MPGFVSHGTMRRPAGNGEGSPLENLLDNPSPFGRLFPAGPATDEDHRAALKELEQMTRDTAGGDLDNPQLKAGATFLGQFIDHDITRMEAEEGFSIGDLTQPAAIDKLRNLRTPHFELDSVYGFGPEHAATQGQIFRTGGDHGYFRLGSETGGQSFDVPRKEDGEALIGDARNDENKVIVQLHNLFQRFHNLEMEARDSYPHARNSVVLTYQTILLNEYLPTTCRPDVVAQVRNNQAARFAGLGQANGQPIMPLEFSVAAFRFGHSQVRGGYRLNDNFERRLFTGDSAGDPSPNDRDLNGGTFLSEIVRIDWSKFFGPNAAASRKIDPFLAGPLRKLKRPGIKDDTTDSDRNPRSLAKRNLFRAAQTDCASGQQAAEALGVSPLAESELGLEGLSNAARRKLKDATPLWYYVLREAQVREDGLRLGEVGSHIIAETFIGGMLAGNLSALNPPQDPAPRPYVRCNTMEELTQIVGDQAP